MDNRQLIMDCAKKLFYSKGYDAVGVQEIVSLAGITKPTLYYYFGSKLGLLRTIMETRFAEFRKYQNSILQSDEDIRSLLYKTADYLCVFFDKDREFYILMMSLFYSAQDNEAYQVVKPYVTEFYETVVKAFDHCSDQLGNMNGRQRQFAIGFVGTLNHYLLMQREIDPAQQENISREQIRSLVNQFMYGIFT